MEEILLKVKGAIRVAWNNLKNTFKKIWENVKLVLFKFYKNKKEFKKLFSIYNRTKKKRIKNKYYNKMMKFIISHPIIG